MSDSPDRKHNGGPDIDWSDYGGFIVEARNSRHHPIIGYGKQVKPCDPDRGFCFSVNEAWRDILHECRYRDGYVLNGGHKMLIERGSLVGAVSWLAHRWNWTPKTVRGLLDRLERDGMITLESPGTMTCSDNDYDVSGVGKQRGKQAQVISVCSYDKFNMMTDAEGQAKGQAEGKQGASRGQAEGNNIKKNKETRKQGNNTPQTPEGGLPSADAKPTPRSVAREAFGQWQEFAKAHGLSCPRASTFDAYADGIVSRLREHATEQTRSAMLELWHLALCQVGRSKFLRGQSDGDWKADLGVILRPKNFAKLISGGYGNGAVAEPQWRTQRSEAQGYQPRNQLAPTAEIEGWETLGGEP